MTTATATAVEAAAQSGQAAAHPVYPPAQRDAWGCWKVEHDVPLFENRVLRFTTTKSDKMVKTSVTSGLVGENSFHVIYSLSKFGKGDFQMVLGTSKGPATESRVNSTHAASIASAGGIEAICAQAKAYYDSH